MKLHNIDGVDIPFETHWNSIAISLSGGADSALLAYLLCSLIPSTQTMEVNIISHTRMWKTRPWQQDNSKNVYNWLVERFENLRFARHTNFIAPDIEYGNIGPSIPDEYNKFVSGDNIQQRSFAEYICHKEDCDAYYNAVTRNPRSTNFSGMQERDIEPNESNQHLTLMIHMGRYAVHPFRFVEKDWIIKQYYRLGIESLLNITRSCEGEFKGIDYKTYISGQYVPTCGECFWCKERTWAIEQQH
jgi:7-cyano-7-deazaguanine synthase in queuosine biosynthesis